MRTATLFRTFVATLLLSAACFAEDPRPALAHPRGRTIPYTLSVLDEWGQPLRTFEHEGQSFVLGSYGQRYKILVTNHTATRIEAVVSVDGRDVVSGRVGDFVRERGYLIGPYGSVEIEGFRQSLSRVATFRFTDPADSYSSRMGTPENVGVIGVAIFPERPLPRPQPLAAPVPQERPAAYGRSRGAARPSAGAAPSAPAAASARAGAQLFDDAAEASASTSNLGTQYGESRTSQVREVQFRRADPTRPTQVLTLRYDDERGLLARGIDLYPQVRPVARYDAPNPFPYSRFAPPPR